jgi:hypothetical protein
MHFDGWELWEDLAVSSRVGDWIGGWAMQIQSEYSRMAPFDLASKGGKMVFACDSLSTDTAVTTMQDAMMVPHSRMNFIYVVFC